MRYRLRTLMILLAIGPVLLASVWLGYPKVMAEYRACQWRQAIQRAESAGSYSEKWVVESP